MSRITKTKLNRLFEQDRSGTRRKAHPEPAAERRTIAVPEQSFSGGGLLSVGKKGLPLAIKVSEGQVINWYKLEKRRARRAKKHHNL